MKGLSVPLLCIVISILVITFLTFEGVMQVRHDVRDLVKHTACVCKESLDGGP